MNGRLPTILIRPHSLTRRVLAGAGIVLGLSAPLIAESTATESLTSAIAEAAKRSASELDAARIEDIDTARAEFEQSVDAVRQHLARTATAANAAAWLNYLEIAPAIDAIESDEREQTIAGRATRITHRATGTYPGLEIPAIARLRSAADRYANALRFRQKDRTVRALSVQLQRFSDQWSQLDQTPSADDLATLRLILDLLHRTDQDVALVRATRDRFGASNIRLTIGESLVRRGVEREIAEVAPVRDCILGTRLVGDAWLNGRVSATLLPSPDSVRLQIAMSGSLLSKNRGYNGPVRLRTSGQGQVYAARVVELSDSDVRFEPITASGSLQTRIDRIEHPLRLVRKIARKRAAKQKPQADRIAHGRLITRLTEEFSQQTDQAVGGAMPDLIERVNAMLRRLDLDQPTRSLSSSHDAVFVAATIRKPNELAASEPPPTFPADQDALVQVHESLVNNTLGSILAGRTMTRTELQSLISRAKLDDKVRTDQDVDEFEIDFDRTRPVIFEARDGQLRIGVRGTRFAQGSRELKRPLEIVADYRPLRTDSGAVMLDRVGEAQINFPGTKRLSVSQAGLRGAIQQGFADAFPQSILDRPITLPHDSKVEPLRGLSIQSQLVDARDGWLSIALGISPGGDNVPANAVSVASN